MKIFSLLAAVLIFTSVLFSAARAQIGDNKNEKLAAQFLKLQKNAGRSRK